MLLAEILTSAKQTAIERLSSPLLGSFAVAWCVWNYKFLVILFSSNGVSSTFNLIDTIAFPDAWSVTTRGIVYPVLTAGVYVFLYPYPARFVYEFTLKRQREINSTKQRIYNETPLTLEESQQLRGEFNARERAHNEEVRTLNDEIARLTALLEAKEKLAPEEKLTPAERLYDRLEPSQVEILQSIGESDQPPLESDFTTNTGVSRVKSEFDLVELQRRELIERILNRRRGGYELKLTHAGRRALLKHGGA